MKQNKNLLDGEQCTRVNLVDNPQDKSLSPDEMDKKMNELQQQARYLNRVLEAYSDCV